MKTLAQEQKFHGVVFDGSTYDCGSSLGFLGANVAFALASPEIAPDFRLLLKTLIAKP